jgi:drug/metabolite transporter (DMT)-like permease
MSRYSYLLAASLNGLLMALSRSLLQYGLKEMTAGKAGFLTGAYPVLIPVFGLVIGRKTYMSTWIAALISVGGLYLLSIVPGTETLGHGDFTMLLVAVMFALEIMTTDYYLIQGADPNTLTFTMCVVCLIICIPLALLVDGLDEYIQVWNVRWNILACGSLYSTAHILSKWGQRQLSATNTAIIIVMEAPISALGGMLFLHETWTLYEVLGMCSMLLAVLVAQLGPLYLTKQPVFPFTIDQHSHYNSMSC